jgi:hypothetical protein
MRSGGDNRTMEVYEFYRLDSKMDPSSLDVGPCHGHLVPDGADRALPARDILVAISVFRPGGRKIRVVRGIETCDVAAGVGLRGAESDPGTGPSVWGTNQGVQCATAQRFCQPQSVDPISLLGIVPFYRLAQR